MISYKIIRNSFVYHISYNNEEVYHGKRKQRLFRGDITEIYDNTDNLIATIKQHYFFFFNFGYDIIYQNGRTARVRSENGKWILSDSDKYILKYKLFDKDERVYKNDKNIGTSILIKVDYSYKEIVVSTTTHVDSFIISIMEIAVDNWGL